MLNVLRKLPSACSLALTKDIDTGFCAGLRKDQNSKSKQFLLGEYLKGQLFGISGWDNMYEEPPEKLNTSKGKATSPLNSNTHNTHNWGWLQHLFLERIPFYLGGAGEETTVTPRHNFIFQQSIESWEVGLSSLNLHLGYQHLIHIRDPGTSSLIQLAANAYSWNSRLWLKNCGP